MFGAGLTAVVWIIAVGVTRTAGFGSSLRSMSAGSPESTWLWCFYF